MRNFLTVAKEAAVEAGKVQMRHLGKVRDVRYKSEIDIVTEVDRQSEDLIMKKIRKAFPGHSILAEESGDSDLKSDYRWIVDPLDGTVNYAHGVPIFCVCIGLEYRGEMVMGVVFDPSRNEMFAAEKGKGAMLNGKRMKVSGKKELVKSLLATGFAYDVRKGGFDNFGHFRNFVMSARAVRRLGSAALDACYVACGRFDGYWEIGLNPWDSAAASLIITEAGGRVSRFDGSLFSVYDRQILASNGQIHQQMIDVLCKGEAK